MLGLGYVLEKYTCGIKEKGTKHSKKCNPCDKEWHTMVLKLGTIHFDHWVSFAVILQFKT